MRPEERRCTRLKRSESSHVITIGEAFLVDVPRGDGEFDMAPFTRCLRPIDVSRISVKLSPIFQMATTRAAFQQSGVLISKSVSGVVRRGTPSDIGNVVVRLVWIWKMAAMETMRARTDECFKDEPMHEPREIRAVAIKIHGSVASPSGVRFQLSRLIEKSSGSTVVSTFSF